jgi:hydrogenase maturation protein HypF
MTAVTTPDSVVRHRIRVVGVVQGVGFRPFVHRLAVELGLSGHVGNDAQGVFIEVQGPAATVDLLRLRLASDAPPLASIFHLETSVLAVGPDEEFRIVPSRPGGAVRTYVSPDIGICADCMEELFDPSDLRYRYPFINCTNCGPRFTITTRLPYDRPNTTMSKFELCEWCQGQYDEPADRRFHAQPVACAACGPRLWFDGPGGTVEGTDAALAAAQEALASGQVLAIKGLGGFHLACDAASDEVLARLRERKHRIDKPFAVMVRDLDVAAELAHIDEDEARLLLSPQRPIVLLRKKETPAVAAAVAPHNPRIGILLPYTPLHHLLFAAVPQRSASAPRVLVMTSGNLTDEPICFSDHDARQRLGAIADSWLLHDRPIHVPCDDSVVQVDGGQELPLRRSRGYAPLPVRLPFAVPATLATGGELKTTFCLAGGHDAFLSQHIGDMGSLETLAAFERSTQQFRALYDIVPEQMAADEHPGYRTRTWAEAALGDRVVLVQHHHAHIASLMAEHGLGIDEQVLGFAFDGTGLGTDGSIWGGEVMVAGYGDFERVSHLRTTPLPGGDTAVRRPYRVALAHLWAAGIAWDGDLAPVLHAPEVERTVLARQLERNVQCVPTSSMGRLFDAVSSLLGVQHVASYEAQAAVELEWMADASTEQREYRFDITPDDFDPAPVLRAIVADARRGIAVPDMAAGFHRAVAALIAEQSRALCAATGVDTVALSGGVFQNVHLVRLVREALTTDRLRVLTHRVVPPNDGGLALGQAAIAGYGEQGRRRA